MHVKKMKFLAYSMGWLLLLLPNLISAQVLQNPVPDENAEFKWIFSAHVRQDCKIDEKAIIDTPVERCAFMEEFKMFPNPADIQFTMSIKATSAPIKIMISNLEGKAVFSDHVKDFGGSYHEVIKTKDFGAGVFLVSIMQGEDIFVRKLIIN